MIKRKQSAVGQNVGPNSMRTSSQVKGQNKSSDGQPFDTWATDTQQNDNEDPCALHVATGMTKKGRAKEDSK